MKARTLPVLALWLVAALAFAACAPMPGLPGILAPTASPAGSGPETSPAATAVAVATEAPAPAATAVPPPGAGSDWLTYSNGAAGFSISYPGGWNQTDFPPTETTRGVSLDGPGGTVELRWGTGFGGVCPGGYSTVKVADGEAAGLLHRRGRRYPALGADRQGTGGDLLQRPSVHEGRNASQRGRGPGCPRDAVVSTGSRGGRGHARSHS